MRHWKGVLESADHWLASARAALDGKDYPAALALVHDAIHNYVDGLHKLAGRRGKIPHERVGRLARELGVNRRLAEAISIVERETPRITYGGVALATAAAARRALSTAEALQRFVQRRHSR